MPIEIGQTYASVAWTRVDMADNFVRLGGAEVTIARVAVVELNFICVEWTQKPKHPEYGYPRQWFPRGAFVGGFLFREE